jgi:hypothetical protein
MPSFKDEKIAVLSAIIINQKKFFAKSDNEIYARKPSQNKWSKKEITGHLIDSAMNNIQRFIRAQYENNPAIAYDQDLWVRFNGYQQSDLHSLIDLWILLNERILMIIGLIPEEKMDKTCLVNGKEYSLQWLIGDYIRHLEHHLGQINASTAGV